MKVLASLGILMAIASITFYQSFHYMDAGIASTILFVYPVMVAVIMSAFFKESYCSWEKIPPAYNQTLIFKSSRLKSYCYVL